ncbi:MAG: hypothetical protein ACOY41_09350 [Pseudomonadota bacterium]
MNGEFGWIGCVTPPDQPLERQQDSSRTAAGSVLLNRATKTKP